ncbi:LysR family transcriptional regulator [Cereibacter changlensis]|uniref:LysR family transcriptional regulator n=1 Tax=Cereibacter changlensis TaxID=402884 RepID=A0A4V5NLC5_9RHOB|nr:LysR family transcriptional regulator [Cereibacter changlensis]TKA95117.1 LysR family transcriptional regulator [Cereibacter changlensis]
MQGVHQVAFSRRYLPSLSLLTAFEAVVRTGSTAAAARELNLTQGTVSRLVQGLEAQLGVALFLRQRKRLLPTEAALAYAAEVRRGMDLIGRASVQVTASPGGGTLALAILPTFGTHWLAPRLPGFLKANPGVTINLATRLRPFDFAEEGMDAAIHFGSETWLEAGHLRLFGEDVVAVAAPEFLAAHPVRAAADLLALPLLQLEARPRGWQGWLAHHGIEAQAPRGMVFDQFATMMQAAIHGIGVALLPEFLAAPSLADGALVPVFGGPVAGRHGYWLVWPETRADHPPLAAFRDWLRAETAGLS